MAVEIAEAVVGALKGELAATAVNAPMVPAEVEALSFEIFYHSYVLYFRDHLNREILPSSVFFYHFTIRRYLFSQVVISLDFLIHYAIQLSFSSFA